MEGKQPAREISLATFLKVADELRVIKDSLEPGTTIEFYTVEDVLWYELRSNTRIMFEAP